MAPTWDVPVLFFFRQTTELIAYVPLFTETDKFTQAKFHQCKLTAKGPPFRFLPFLRNLQNRKTPKGPPFQFFFGTVRIFFPEIFNFSKESPLRIFWYFATESMLMNPKGSPFSFFGTMRRFRSFFQKKIFSKKISKIFLFPVEKSDFPVISSMKGTLWVSRKCFQSFSWIHPGHI